MGWTDYITNIQTDRQVYGWTDRPDGQAVKQMDRLTNTQTDGWVDAWTRQALRWIDVMIYGQTNKFV